MEAPPSKTYILLTSVHNDIDDAENTDADEADNADNYNRVIGISKCEQKFANTQTHPDTDGHPYMSDFNKLSTVLSLTRNLHL